MAHHPYNTHMIRHMEWTKAGATTVEMLTGAPTTVSMSTPLAPTSVSIASAPGTWPAAASELCEVVLNECLRQQHQAALAVVAQQQTNPSVVTTSTITIAQDHEVPTLSTVSMDEVLRADMLSGQTLLAPGTSVTLPLQVVSTVSPSKSRRCSKHHHRHHHHHHHNSSDQDKISYTVSSYPCRYRLPSSDLLPNHEELLAAGAIPSSPPHTLVLSPQPQPSPVVDSLEIPLSVPESTIVPSSTKIRKPRASRARGGNVSSKKSDGISTSLPVPTPVTSTSTFPCPECGKKFLWASRLVVHRRSHTGEKPFPCTQCGAAFAQRWILAVHMRTHNPPEITPEQQTLQQVDVSGGQIVRQTQPLMAQHVQQQVEI